MSTMSLPAHDRAFHRPPRDFPAQVPTDEIVIAAPPASHGGQRQTLLYVLFPIIGSLGIFAFALVYRNRLFLYVACAMVAITIVFAFGLRWSQNRQGKKAARRQRRRYREYLTQRETLLADVAAAQRASAERLFPDPPRLLALVRRREGLWERRPDDKDFLTLRAGRGSLPHAGRPRLDLGHNPVAEYDVQLVEDASTLVAHWSSLRDVPVGVPLQGVVSIVGPLEQARAVGRSLLVQLGTFHAPTEARVAVAGSDDDADAWEWIKWLPHARELAAGDDGGPPIPLIARSVDGLAQLLDAQVGPRVAALQAMASTNTGLQRPTLNAPTLLIVVGGFRPTDPALRLPLMREVLANGRALRVCVLALVESWRDEPAETRLRIRPGDRELGSVEETGPDGCTIDGVRLDSTSISEAEAIARAIAPIELQRACSDRGFPPDAGLFDLLGVRGVADLDPTVEWRPRPPHQQQCATLGLTDTGERVVLDLKEAADGGMGPHGLIIGTTGSGKSELLRTLVAGLAITHSPEELAFVFIDYKGGLALSEFEALPHTAGSITNLKRDMRLVDRVYEALFAEQERRQELLLRAGDCETPAEYRRFRVGHPELPPLPDLLVLIDEFGELLDKRSDFIDLFVAIGRVGRQLGIRLLFSSQRFDEGRWRGLESNLRYRIGLRTQTAVESKAVLGTPDAALLPSDPGGAFLKVDTGIYERFRTVVVGAAEQATAATAPTVARFGATGLRSDPVPTRRAAGAAPTQLRELAEHLARAAGADGRVHRIWLDPLDPLEPLDAVTVETASSLGAAIGTVDLPRDQKREPLILDFAAEKGHLAVVGAPQSGKSTVLRTLLLALTRTHDPAVVEAAVIDLGGGLLRALTDLPHIQAVAGRGDRELVRQIVAHVGAELERREAAFARLSIESMAECRHRNNRGETEGAFADLFLIVDGWATFRRDFEGLDLEIEAIASAGLAYGVHVVVTASRWAEIRLNLLDNLGGRLELHLNDALDSSVDRKKAANLPTDCPGRGLLVPTGEEFQAALPRLDGRRGADDLGTAAAAAAREIASRYSGARAAPVRVLPRRLAASDILTDHPDAANHRGVIIGLDGARFEPVGIDLLGADPHFLVFGDGQSGRTNLLHVLARGLSSRFTSDEAQLILIDPRRTLSQLRDLANVRHYASNSTAASDVVDLITTTLNQRLEEVDNASDSNARRSGPRLVMLIDDYDVLPPMTANPLTPLAEALPYGRDIGLHVVLARRVAGASRVAFEPFLQRLFELSSPGLLLSGSPKEPPLLGERRASAQPPGRGRLVRPGQPEITVQTLLDEPSADSRITA